VTNGVTTFAATSLTRAPTATIASEHHAMAWQRPQPFPRHLELDPHHVELVEFDLARTSDEPLDVLSAEERARADRFGRDLHRGRFIAGRSMLRVLLGEILRLAPRDVIIHIGRNGKPELAREHASPIRFNLSHSEDRAVVALALGRKLGVDVERVRSTVDAGDIALRFFAPGESTALLGLPEPRRHEAFFRCWTCKESYLKARGDGLLVRLDAFEVEPAEHPTRLRWSSLDAGDVTRWCMNPLDLNAGYVAALTIEGASHIRRWSAPAREERRRATVT
jgi:4'-phosphopantetheinyl transferase